MPALVQICIVIVTLGLLAIVVMTARMMNRFNKATHDLSQMTDEARTLVASLRNCVTPLQRVVERFEEFIKERPDQWYAFRPMFSR